MTTRTHEPDLAVAAVRVRNEVERPLPPKLRGASIWTGFAIGFALWMLLELLLFATDLAGVDVGIGNADTSSWFWNGVAALVAFFVGGYIAGWMSPTGSVSSGAVSGAAVWAIGLLAALVLTGIVGGIGFGALGDVFGFERALSGAGSGARIAEQTANDFREAAGWAAAFVAGSLALAAIGGALGSRTPVDHRDDIDVRGGAHS